MTLFHHIPGAPDPVGPFAHATEADGWVALTGQMPTWPGEPERPIPDGLEAQARRVLDNLLLVLQGLQLDLSHVMQCRCYLTEFARDFDGFNAVYASYFPAGRCPARTTIGVTALAVGALVEVDMLARRP